MPELPGKELQEFYDRFRNYLQALGRNRLDILPEPYEQYQAAKERLKLACLSVEGGLKDHTPIYNQINLLFGQRRCLCFFKEADLRCPIIGRSGVLRRRSRRHGGSMKFHVCYSRLATPSTTPNAFELNGDNQGALALTENPEIHQKTKHMVAKYRFVRDEVGSRRIS